MKLQTGKGYVWVFATAEEVVYMYRPTREGDFLKDLLKDDYAKVVGKKPVVITFATPLLCQSRVCGPVVDIVEQARAETSADVAFIHQEIYNDNQVNKGFRPQVVAWHLPTEPWTFVVNKKGRVSARFEGAFSTGELERAIAKVTRKT